DAHVRAVSAVQIGERELAAVLFEAAVRARHVEVAREVEVAAFASDLERGPARADGHADGAALQHLRQTERARILRRRIEVGAVGVLSVARARRRVEAEELL